MTEASVCFQKEILADGIVLYRAQVITGECADLWFDDIAAEFARANVEQRHIRLLYDLRKVTRATPYMLQRIQQLASLPYLPENWHVASVTGNAFVTGIVHFVKTTSLVNPNLFKRSEIFDGEAEALGWLRSQ